jgi:multidrug efflux pump subunit AcrA (membrane-fusion protein)
MNTKALILLALTCPIILGANMLARKCASSETHPAAGGTASVTRTNEVSDEIAESASPADSARPEPRMIVGVVIPATVVDVRSQVNGIIDSFSKSVGDSVDSTQPLATLDSADLLLEAQSQQARLAAAGHRVAAAEIDLKILQEQETHMLDALKTNAASQFEVSQLRRQVESASAKLKGSLEDSKEQQVAARSIEQRMHKYRCLSPISGRIIEVGAVKGAYVREGQLIAKVQSTQQHLNVGLPADVVEQLQTISFRFQQRSDSVILAPVEVTPNCNLDGTRCVRLAIPAGCDLVVGQILRVEVSVKP